MPDDKSISKKMEGLKNKFQDKLRPKGTEDLPEKPEAPQEAGVEMPSPHEKPDIKQAESTGEGEVGSVGAAVPPVSQQQQQSKEREKKIEQILEGGLEEMFLEMPPIKQQEFKQSGEETAKKINELVESGKAGIKKIVDLIKKWLSVIPGVNRFFLEQEAKIKADEIMKEINKDILDEK